MQLFNKIIFSFNNDLVAVMAVGVLSCRVLNISGIDILKTIFEGDLPGFF